MVPGANAAHSKCKAHLKIGHRTTCVSDTLHPAASADQSKLAAQAALSFPLAGVRDRHGHHARTLKGKDVKLVDSALATALAKASTLGETASAHAADDSRCLGTFDFAQKERELKEYEEAHPQMTDKEKAEARKEIEDAKRTANSSFTSGNTGIDLSVANGTTTIGINVKDKNLRIEVALNLCDDKAHFQLDACPTAEGVANGSDKIGYGAAVRVFEGGKLIYLQSFALKGETTFKAQTGNDAKVDHYDVKHVYKTVVGAGGTKQAFGPVTIDFTYIGEARVDMRSSGNPPPHAVVSVMMSGEGFDPHDRIQGEIAVAHKEQQKADENFAAEVKKITEALRHAEKRWQEPNHCATMSFAPASETLTLNTGESGSVTSTVAAKAGGQPKQAVWTVSGQQNAVFAPGAGEPNPLKTAYEATNAGTGVRVQGTFKATSPAGVAEAKWTQKTKEGLVLPARFSGTVKGTVDYGGRVKAQWEGSLVLSLAFSLTEPFPGMPTGQYKISSGSLRYSFKGHEFECDVAGEGTIDLTKDHNTAGSLPLKIYEGTPRTYEFLLRMAEEASIEGTKSNCAHGGDGPFTWFVYQDSEAIAYAPYPGGPVASDWSVAGSGSGTTLASGVVKEPQTWEWDLKAEP
jgi:hypothetical protein